MFQLLAGVLAFFYGIIPNYAVAIALLTFAVMLVLSPLTLKGTRGMLAMQKLQPEMKRLQQEHKGDRQKLGEEMTKLYKEHKANPAAGCLPMLLQMPVFLVMYQVINGLTKMSGDTFDPKYLDKGTELYKALSRTDEMKSFGVDLARSASDGHGSFAAALPFFAIVVLVVLTQYYQTRQTMARNTAAASNPQQQLMLKVLPGFFGLISLSIPAGVNIYFLVSGLFRILQTGAMYRFDPALAAHAKRHAKEIEAKATEVKPAKPKAVNGRTTEATPSNGSDTPGKGRGKPPPPRRPTNATNGNRNASTNKRRPKRRTKRGR